MLGPGVVPATRCHNFRSTSRLPSTQLVENFYQVDRMLHSATHRESKASVCVREWLCESEVEKLKGHLDGHILNGCVVEAEGEVEGELVNGDAHVDVEKVDGEAILTVGLSRHRPDDTVLMITPYSQEPRDPPG
jgi:hypothetical protein